MDGEIHGGIMRCTALKMMRRRDFVELGFCAVRWNNGGSGTWLLI